MHPDDICFDFAISDGEGTLIDYGNRHHFEITDIVYDIANDGVTSENRTVIFGPCIGTGE